MLENEKIQIQGASTLPPELPHPGRADDRAEEDNRARKSRRTLQNKVRIDVFPVQFTRFVSMFVAFRKCIIQ